MFNVHLDIPLKSIEEFCLRHPIRKLSLFGSVLCDDFRPDSDVDVLVEFETGARISYLDLAGMQIELQEIFGRSVDIGTPDMLRKHMSKQVLESAQTIYES